MNPTPPSFDELQHRLVERLRDTTPEQEARTIVVCPSLSFPVAELRKITGIRFYEERLLFLVLLLRDPALELVYPTSVAIDEAVVRYYLGWLPDPAEARRRLHMVDTGDPSPSSLSEKLLARPELLRAIRERIADPEDCFILPFNVTAAEARLAEALGVPLYGARPDLTELGSKSGGRRVAAEAGVDVFEGSADLYSLAALEDAVHRLASARPGAAAAVVKLNNGFSGQGNLILDLGQLQRPLSSSPAAFCAAEESWPTYLEKVEKEGAIVEELVRAPGTTSPSVQLRILPGGRCEVVSTHDQILGGPDDQVYIGCRFPADERYRSRIQQAALRVGGVLADRGVLGSFGIDFVVVGGRQVFLSEINLRMGGTTHPFLMTRLVTGGTYDPGCGELLVDGSARVYLSSDNVKSERYIGLAPRTVIEALTAAGLAYHPGSGTGATLHLLSALPEYGKFGMVCIAESHQAAEEQYQGVLALVDSLAATVC